MNTILLTGATGFIGSHIAEYFTSMGEKLRCLVRESSDQSFLKTLAVELAFGDITDIPSLDKAAEGCTTIIHVAGYARDWGKTSDFHKFNVEGTLNVLRTAKKHNINRIIITGSISSYGEENCLHKKDENSPFNSHYPYFLDPIFPCKMNYYRDSKANATQQAIDFAKKEKLNLIIMEPVWVYGEREFNTGFYDYLHTVKKGSSLLPGSKKNKFHTIYAGELARAYYLAFKSNIQGIERIIIGDREACNMNDFYTRLCIKAGLKKPKNVFKALFYPLAFLLELFATIIRSKKPPLLTRGRVNMFYDNIEYESHKAKQLLGFEPILSMEESFERTVTWYKSNNYL